MIGEGFNRNIGTDYYAKLKRCMTVWGSLTPEKIDLFGTHLPDPENDPKSVSPSSCISKDTILDVFAFSKVDKSFCHSHGLNYFISHSLELVTRGTLGMVR